MIYYKTNEEIELIRQSSLIVSKALAEVAANIRAGSDTLRLDKIAEEFIRDNGGIPAFKGLDNFPYTLCISANEAVVHGLPDSRELIEGDIVSIDCGVLYQGFYSDTAYTFGIGNLKPETEQLLFVTKESLFIGIEKAVAGNRVGDIGFAVQQHAENHGYSVVRELVGHGLGKSLHEDPEIPNYGSRGKGTKLQEGLVIAIEPMVNMGKKDVRKAKDNWTIITNDRMPSAHYELTVAVRKYKADPLSTFEFIEEEVKKNKELTEINIKKPIFAG